MSKKCRTFPAVTPDVNCAKNLSGNAFIRQTDRMLLHPIFQWGCPSAIFTSYPCRCAEFAPPNVIHTPAGEVSCPAALCAIFVKFCFCDAFPCAVADFVELALG